MTEKNLDRRTLVKGAAWSVPVLATAVAAPLAAASDLWNVRVKAGCVVGVAGLNLLPGFTISETTGNAPLGSLSFTQTITYAASYDWSSIIPGAKDVSKAAAVAVGNGNISLYLGTGLIQFESANLSTGAWSPNLLAGATYTEGATENRPLAMRRTHFTLTRTRAVTVSNLGAGGKAGITYLTNAPITLPAASLNNTLSANNGSGGNINSDDSDVLTWELISLGC